jgi:hypothetical protein
MFAGRRFAAAATTCLLITGGFFLLLFAQSPAAAASGSCANSAEVTVLPSPQAPWTGAPLRVMVVAEKPVEGVLSLIAPDGSAAVKSSDRHDGPPYSWFAEIAAPAAGTWHALQPGHPRDRRQRTQAEAFPHTAGKHLARAQ